LGGKPRRQILKNLPSAPDKNPWASLRPLQAKNHCAETWEKKALQKQGKRGKCVREPSVQRSLVQSGNMQEDSFSAPGSNCGGTRSQMQGRRTWPWCKKKCKMAKKIACQRKSWKSSYIKGLMHVEGAYSLPLDVNLKLAGKLS
jgi:hypothetical protein